VWQITLKTCSTKTVSSDHNHYNPRFVSKKLFTGKKLGLIKFIQAQLKLTSASPRDNVAIVFDRKKENQPLCKTLVDLNHPKTRPSPPSIHN